MSMKFEFFGKNRKRKKRKHSKRKGSQKFDSEEVPIKSGERYFAIEHEIDREWDKEQLEYEINHLIKNCPEYGDVCLKIAQGKIHIYKGEMLGSQIEYEYVVKLVEDGLNVSTEQNVRELKERNEIGQSCQLVDVTFYSIYRILIFRK